MHALVCFILPGRLHGVGGRHNFGAASQGSGGPGRIARCAGSGAALLRIRPRQALPAAGGALLGVWDSATDTGGAGMCSAGLLHLECFFASALFGSYQVRLWEAVIGVGSVASLADEQHEPFYRIELHAEASIGMLACCRWPCSSVLLWQAKPVPKHIQQNLFQAAPLN